MLSYQHSYHAGNFADVIKHLVLTRLIAYLTQKDKPLLYLETHAGRGLYDLQDKEAQKTGESKLGINLLWGVKEQQGSLFEPYLQAIVAHNKEGGLRYYPGSPALAVQGLRACDRLYLCELHPREYEALQKMPRNLKRVHVSASDGVASLKALLPPPEKRGLIFMDPSYEVKEEYKTIPLALKQAYKQFAPGVFCLWYPVVDRRTTDSFLRRLEAIEAGTVLHLEFNLKPAQAEGMTGCGLWIINPPFTLTSELELIMPVLKKCFNPELSSYVLRQL